MNQVIDDLSQLTLVNGWIAILEDEPDRTTPSGIHIGAAVVRRDAKGTVVARSPGSPYKIGMRVLRHVYAGQRAFLEGHEVVLVKQDDIIAHYGDIEAIHG